MWNEEARLHEIDLSKPLKFKLAHMLTPVTEIYVHLGYVLNQVAIAPSITTNEETTRYEASPTMRVMLPLLK